MSTVSLEPLTPTFSSSTFSSSLLPAFDFSSFTGSDSAYGSSSSSTSSTSTSLLLPSLTSTTFSITPHLSKSPFPVEPLPPPQSCSASPSHPSDPASLPLSLAPPLSSTPLSGASCSTPAPLPRSTCVSCREAKVRCDGETPCKRCTRLHKADHCHPASNKRKRTDPTAPTGADSPLSASTEPLPPPSSHPVALRPFPGPATVLEQLDPLGAYTSPLSPGADHGLPSSTLLSRLLLRYSLRSFHRGVHSRPRLGDPGRPLATMTSKYLAYARYAHLLTPPDLASMLHGSAFISGVPLKEEAGGKALLRLHERSAGEDGHCTGRVCGGMCLGPRRMMAATPLHFAFHHSPLDAMDEADVNNFPCLAFRHEASDDLHRLQRHVESDGRGDAVWPGGVVDYSVVVQVNGAFERLFGYSQRQVRAMFQQHSFFALYELLAVSDWGRVMGMEVAVDFGTGGVEYEGSYQMNVRGRHRTGSEFACLVQKVYERDELGMVAKGYFTFIPIRETDAAAVDLS